ncbi:MAG: redox-regulated ATPase YchF, partial [Candidatus Levybacteria bacterium RIFCSPHIGHO2_02_FULL_42_12]
IAGLVKGAHKGAGLGNKFLSHIREVSIVAHVVRAFSDENIVKEGSVDPMSDYQTVQTELILADLQSIENAKGKAKPFGFAQGESLKQQSKAQNGLEKVREALNRGISARDIKLTDEEREAVRDMFLLSLKPEIVVFNVLEEDYGKDGEEKMLVQWSSRLDCGKENIMVICAKIESELSELSEKDQKEYLQNLGLQESGLEKLIKEAYKALDLISFLTAGAKEVRAWTIKRGTKALDAAGVIHTDFTKHFIKAEVVSFDDFVNLGGWKKAREAGKTRFEGRDYIMQDGDVVEFKIGN